MLALKVAWRPTPRAPDLSDLKAALSANPSRPRVLVDRGDVEGAIRGAAKRLTRQYLWPYQMHASIGPSAALADVGAGRRARLVRHAESVVDAPRSRAAAGSSRERDRSRPHGGCRLLRAQRRGRRHGRRRAAVARGRTAGAGATHARSGAPVGAKGRGAAHERGWRPRR